MHTGWLMAGILALALAQGPALEQRPAPLTPYEQLQVELLKTRTLLAQALVQMDACRAEVGQAHDAAGKLRAENATLILSAEEAKLKAAIDAARPGFAWDPKSGAFTKKGGE